MNGSNRCPGKVAAAMLLVATLLAVTCACSPALAAERTQIDVMIAQHNAFRAEVGLPQQVLDSGLCSYAQDLANRQAAAGQMFHSGSEWPWPECVCYGASGGQHAVAMWIDSPPHRAILCSNTTAVGFGFRNGFAAALFGEPVAVEKPHPAKWETDSPADQAPSEQDQLALADGLLLPESPRICADGSCGTAVVRQSSTIRVVSGPTLVRRGWFGAFRGRCGRGGCN